MEAKLPIINLELSSGVFRIKTTDAVYQISVVPAGSLTKVVEKVVEKEIERSAAWDHTGDLPEPAGDDFFQSISEELYTEVGKLARNLSLSIKEIPSPTFRKVDIETTGQELENAKGQLEDIVQMTEKATMEIMDLSESIQEDLKLVGDHLVTIKNLEFMVKKNETMNWAGDEAQESGDAWDGGNSNSPLEEHLAFLDRLITQETSLRDLVEKLPPLVPSQPTEPPQSQAIPESQPAPAKVYKFDTDVVFQTLYELCTNEAVKDHIKAMRAEQETSFDTAIVRKTLADLAPTVDVEDNFFNFPIAGILKGLYQATSNDRYRQVLKKMNQTVASIFLDTILPVEGQVQEVAPPISVAAEPAPTVSGPSSPQRPGLPPESIAELLELTKANLSGLLQEKERLAALADGEEPRSPVSAGDDGLTCINIQDREQVIAGIEDSAEIIGRVTANITKILEALSFQDLSGQRIQKIVQLIGEIQVQLLTLLVSFGSRIKKRKDGQTTIPVEETAKLAQSEVDMMLERVTSTPSKLEGPEAAGRLDQNAVNSLLEDLGF
jgi:chemotaxis regulatin CheY-phosphate phosphatase CheZ